MVNKKRFDIGFLGTSSGITPRTLDECLEKKIEWKIDGQSKQGVLPDGYTQLEYIQSDGHQYIDTGIIPNSSTKIEIDCKRNTGTTFGALFGSRSTSQINCFCSFYSSSTTIRFDYAQNNQQTGSLPGSNVRVLLTKDGASNYIDGELVNENTGSAFTGEYSMYLLQVNTGGSATTSYPVGANIYSCKIWQDGTTLSRNFIPAKNSSNVLGMYDLVTGQFFTNAGTDNFEAGPALPTPTNPVDVRGVGNSGLPNGYKKLEYIQSSGTQAFNTEYLVKTGDEFEIRVTSDNASANKNLFGNNSSNSSSAILDYYNNLIEYQYNTGSYERSVPTLDWTTPQIIKMNSDGIWANDVKLTLTTPPNPLTDATGDNTIWFNVRRGGTAYASAKYYYFTITNNGVVKYHIVPAQRELDDKVGMYDIISGTFYSSSTSTDFIAGPEDTSYVVPVKVNSGLPNGYKKLEYIEGNGSAYIDTGFKANQDTSVEVEFAPKETPDNTGIAVLFCSSSAWSNASYGFYKYANWYSNYNSDTPLSDVTIPVGTKAKFYKDKNLVYIDDTLVYTHTEVTFQSSTNLLLGKISISSQYGSYAKYYTCKIWDNGTLVRNFIPAKRISDSVLGMYDTVTNTFFTNQGTGTFTAGPEAGTVYNINLPAPLQKIETYKDTIESDGTLTRGVGIKVLDGTETWTISSGILFCTPISDMAKEGAFRSTSIACSHFKVSTSSEVGNCFKVIKNFNCVPDITLYPDVVTFKSWLAEQYVAGTPCCVVYPLETPTETTVEVPVISTQKGTNYIDVETDVKPSNMSVTYRKRTK